MNKIIAIIAGLMTLCTASHAFNQQEVSVKSNKMNKHVLVTVITPDGYDQARQYPVIYLLHGYSDNHMAWTSRGVVPSLSDQYDIIFVLPDGGYDSWYFDSPVCPEYQYETFITSELIPFIDNN